MFALAAFVIWGMYPLYFKWLGAVPVVEIMAQRVLWTVLLLGLLLLATGRWRAARSLFADRRLLATLALSATLLTANWFVFIWAILHDRVLEGSLGYYINPLVNVLLAVVFLRERLRPLAWAAVALAVAGVAFPIWTLGQPPWISLFLGFSFGFYGLIRKLAPVDAFAGLFTETLILLPPALAYVGYLAVAGGGHFATVSLETDLGLVSTGLVTAAPLVLFVLAAKRLNYATVGFFQYLAPSMHFVFAIWLFGEPLYWQKAVTFACIWAALVLYSLDNLLAHRRGRRREG
ncbi:MAG: EamA family transporter RarD [Hyphomicrobiales bacterium]|nr:EamA family transporter RarD [Hyphomicrobiales bacterium]